MDELISEFVGESRSLVVQLTEILESIEGDYSQYKRLEEYGQIVDRIMGAAKSLAPSVPESKSTLELIGKYGELCKTISYKGSQISDNEGLYSAVVACLLDATEMLEEMLEALEAKDRVDMNKWLSDRFVDRLLWISDRLPAHLRGSLQGSESKDSIQGLLNSFGARAKP